MDEYDIDKIEHMLDKAFEDAERSRKELDAAIDRGKEILQVLCSQDTKRGDIIDITQADLEDGEDREEKKAKVVNCYEISAMDPETFKISLVKYAWCIALRECDITTEEEFADLYAAGDASDTLCDAPSEGVEEADPLACACGANREMCERNQKVFGGHLNE